MHLGSSHHFGTLKVRKGSGKKAGRQEWSGGTWAAVGEFQGPLQGLAVLPGGQC